MTDDTVTAIVLGGSAGVGRAVVDALVAEGHRVGVIARGEERLAALAAAHGNRVVTASADVGDADLLRAAVARLTPGGAGLRVWVNCAMATSFSPFHKMQTDEFDQIVRTTFTGQVNGTRLALELMTEGRIVCVGSGLAYRPVPGQSAYCAAKHAINGFVGAIRSELLDQERPITISLIQLPAINTPQFTWARNRLDMMPQPAPPIFTPQVAARAVMKAVHSGARELLVGKSVIKLVFGDMVLPGLADRILARDGVEMQKSDRPEPGGRPDNLFAPVDHPPSAEGAFSDRASDSALIIDADLARQVFFIGGAVALVLLGVLIGALF